MLVFQLPYAISVRFGKILLESDGIKNVTSFDTKIIGGYSIIHLPPGIKNKIMKSYRKRDESEPALWGKIRLF